MAYHYMPKIFHDHHKNPPDLSPAPPPTYLMYGPLPRVNNFDIKQKKMEYLFHYKPPTPKKIWEDKD